MGSSGNPSGSRRSSWSEDRGTGTVEVAPALAARLAATLLTILRRGMVRARKPAGGGRSIARAIQPSGRCARDWPGARHGGTLGRSPRLSSGTARRPGVSTADTLTVVAASGGRGGPVPTDRSDLPALGPPGLARCRRDVDVDRGGPQLPRLKILQGDDPL